ncbi:MAG: hypothetical protein HY070_13105 [Chloroflexi bacterium]|nr:hypothetical protein [Chloroflexota bacterium]
MAEVQIGQVSHFYNKISVAMLTLTDKLRVGDTMHFHGHATDFQQAVTSLQVEHQPVNEAGPGEVAMKVEQRVHPHDAVFKITG